MPYDNLCKALVELNPLPFVHWLVGQAPTPIQILKTELSNRFAPIWSASHKLEHKFSTCRRIPTLRCPCGCWTTVCAYAGNIAVKCCR